MAFFLHFISFLKSPSLKNHANSIRFFSVFVCLVLFKEAGFAQLKADFTSSVVSGCTPVVVQFKDASAGAPTSYYWDFGNGSTSSLQNPGAIYKNPGFYTVKLIIKDGAGQDSVTKANYITVYAKPIVDFSATPMAGCSPLPVQFNDNSTPASGTITQWSWDFGDGQVSNGQNPLHIYTTVDTFGVSLRVTNSFGCTNFIQKNSFINVNGVINLDFDYTYTNACTPPTKVTFGSSNNTSTPLTYQWDFGDGGASSQQNPVYTYKANGQYSVTLIASTDQGCKDTITKSISIGTVLANFILPPGGCANQVVLFRDSSSPAPVFDKWDFGDGKTANSLNPYHTFSTTGSFNVKLVANFGSCTDSITKIFTVTDKPTPSFTSTGNRSTCTLPSTIQFNNTSANAVSYRWDFGDGGKSTLQNPVHNYTTAGFYNVTLIAINSNGCGDTIIMPKYVQLGPPKIDSLKNSPFAGCIPATINFNPAISSGESVTSYKWDFGDGNTSTSAAPSNNYINAGTYTVNLQVATSSGCTGSAKFTNVVRVGKKPAAKFSASPTDACSSKPIQFTDNSTGGITAWQWKFGDTAAISPLQNPQHLYTDTGYFSVTLTVESNGCRDSLKMDNYIHINPPVSNFTYKYQCGQNKLTRNFFDNSIGAETWTWDFGDGATSNEKDPTHTFTSGGTYIVTLTITNSACSSVKKDTLDILTQAPSFKVQPASATICRTDTVQFTATQYDPSSISAFYWDFGDGTNTGFNKINSTVTHKFQQAGNFTPYLVARDILGCQDTIKKAGLQITVYGPRAAFTNTNGACVNGTVAFADASVTDGIHDITKWTWSYGDGTVESSTAPFQHVYNTSGIYQVVLKVEDSYGCIDSVVKSHADTITSPIANFSSFDSIRCTASAVNFIDSSQGLTLTYNWNFGDNETSGLPSPQHVYTNQGTYTVALGITDKFGCKDSITKVQYIKIADVKAAFLEKDTFAYCPPLRILPKNESFNYTFLTWDFGDGNTSNLFDPDHTYTAAGKYNLMLVAQGHGSCADTAMQTITLLGPAGSFSYSPDQLCVPGTVLFSAKGHNVVGYQWVFADGSVDASADPATRHNYKTPGMYLPSLIIIDSSGCEVTLQNTGDSIRVAGVSAKFSATTSPGCDSALVSITDSSAVLFDNLQSNIWNYGDGSTSNGSSPGHFYATSGNKKITQTITSALGCTDKYTLPVDVVVYQSPVINASIPSSVCVNSTANFTASNNSVPPGNVNWLWQFGNGDTSSAQNPAYTYTTSNTYTVTVAAINEFGCADTADATIIAQPLPPVDANIDSIICLGQSVTLQPSGASTYVWANDNSLSCTNCANPIAKPDTTTRYYVTGTSAAGCVAVDSVLIEVKRPFTITLPPADTLCLGNSIQLTASGAEVYNWQPATGLDDANIANPVAMPTVTTTYTVTGSDVKKCFTASASIIVNVYQNPSVNIADTSVTIMVGDKYIPVSTISPDVIKWQWLPPAGLSCSDCAQPVASPRETTTYQEKVFNQYGCSAEDNITITVLCNEKSLFIPNTFSPNGDGLNDYFYPRGAGLYNIKSMRIFNRLGQIVFERINFSPNDAAGAWDGKFKGKLQPSDVYIYVIDVVCINGTVLSSKGNVTLLR